MSKTMCPGQDTAFWKPGDIFEVTCGECGRELEFFKDDASRRCPGCGKRVANPQLNLGCAMWCEHAKECLGYDPKEQARADDGGQASLADRLFEALRAKVGAGSPIMQRAAEVHHRVEEIMAAEGGDPRVVLAASILLPAGAETAEEVLKGLKLDANSRDDVLEVIRNLNKSGVEKNTDMRIVWDADRLASLAENGQKPGPARAEALVNSLFLTGKGKELARAALG